MAIAGDLPDCDPPPTPVERVAPEYPIVESPIPINGYAVVVFTISESGNVEDVELVESGADPSHSGFAQGLGDPRRGQFHYGDTNRDNRRAVLYRRLGSR